MKLGSASQDTVHIEQAGGDAAGQPKRHNARL